ncbi:disease resistance protein RPM1-like [Trifolium pratense]|uniref:disease resistance protein RPM1-like n=1 Tax=Trifolium pratense TaxID=57577 RepID=UPI001E6914C7|nr:disease resistance protein RPM1-like [Trifolium pratense]
MAEMAVSFAIDKLLPLLIEEVNLLKGVHKEFADIKDELESMQAFLKDADRRAATEGDIDNTSEGVKTWVKHVREAAFRIEDIIDDYLIHVEQQPLDDTTGCVAVLHKIAQLLKTMIHQHQIASEIQDIKLSVRGIKERSKRYGFQIQNSIEQGSRSFRGSQNAKWHDPRMASLYLDEAEIIGFQEPKNELTGWLLEGRSERTVIAVVGMGGLGKTTLAKQVFNNKEVVGHFDCRVWITVSESYYIEGLLRGMLNELYKQKGDTPPQDISQMDRGSLISVLRNYLQQKRYVFVFDDVWNIHFWNEIENACIDNRMGSKIFITTRKMDVAKNCQKSSFIEVHQLQPLTDDQSFELFKKKTFQFDDSDGCCPNKLNDISFKIAKKCKGLPLAIVAIGGLLSTKEKNVIEWRRFCKNMTLELKKDSNLIAINKILALSYEDLPFHLKSCLLYFGMYPEDYIVHSKTLIRQWIAEGFVKEESGNTLEEVAEGYLTELIHRSLVQVSSVTIDGKTKSCCVHDLTRAMILEKCEDLSFCKNISGNGHSSLSGSIRRLSITTHSNDFMKRIENSRVRSLFLFADNSQLLSEDFTRRIFREYRRLKVLEFGVFSNVRLSNILRENLGSLIHLKYLSFNIVELIKLPESISMLQNLETLDMRHTIFYDLPKEVSKLRKLQHLLSSGMWMFKLKGGIGGMESLQTLSSVKIEDGDDGIKIIKELGKLRQLRKLSLFHVMEDHISTLSSSLNEMQHLENLSILSITVTKNCYDLTDLHLNPPPSKLRTLKLIGMLKKFPEWILQLQNLVKLKLEYTKLIDDPIKLLENMQNLLFLSIIKDAYKGESLHFHDGGFQNLKELHLIGLTNLYSIVIEKGALQSLKKFELYDIPNLKTVPAGIQHLEKLQVLNVRDVPHVELYPKL